MVYNRRKTFTVDVIRALLESRFPLYGISNFEFTYEMSETNTLHGDVVSMTVTVRYDNGYSMSRMILEKEVSELGVDIREYVNYLLTWFSKDEDDNYVW